MTGIEYAAVAAAVAATASAGMSYKAATDQASAGKASARLRQEQARTEAMLAKSRASEQEEERQRRAGLAESTNKAAAAKAGIDPFMSPSFGAIDLENDRLVQGDIGSIRMLGSAGQRRAMMEGRGAAFEEGVWGAMGRSAWIRPTLSLIGTGANLYGGTLGQNGQPGSQPGSTPGLTNHSRTYEPRAGA